MFFLSSFPLLKHIDLVQSHMQQQQQQQSVKSPPAATSFVAGTL
jgi:hypothetical protein